MDRNPRVIEHGESDPTDPWQTFLTFDGFGRVVEEYRGGARSRRRLDARGRVDEGLAGRGQRPAAIQAADQPDPDRGFQGVDPAADGLSVGSTVTTTSGASSMTRFRMASSVSWSCQDAGA